jgi:radical SAM-linked protein
MCEPIRVRLCFAKGAVLRFVGHLDFARIFRQAVRRAGLPVAYSQGFNPHMRLTFALPLALGMASQKDYADIMLIQPPPLDVITQQLNACAPDGLRFNAAALATGNAAAQVCIADYAWQADIPAQALQDVLNRPAIILPKKTKSGIKDTDIKADIYSLQKDGDTVILRLAAGSMRFVNPLTVANLFAQAADASGLTRTALFDKDGQPL